MSGEFIIKGFDVMFWFGWFGLFGPLSIWFLGAALLISAWMWHKNAKIYMRELNANTRALKDETNELRKDNDDLKAEIVNNRTSIDSLNRAFKLAFWWIK